METSERKQKGRIIEERSAKRHVAIEGKASHLRPPQGGIDAEGAFGEIDRASHVNPQFYDRCVVGWEQGFQGPEECDRERVQGAGQ